MALKKGKSPARGKGGRRPKGGEDLALEVGKKLAIPCEAKEWVRFYGLVAARLKGFNEAEDKPAGPEDLAEAGGEWTL